VAMKALGRGNQIALGNSPMTRTALPIGRAASARQSERRPRGFLRGLRGSRRMVWPEDALLREPASPSIGDGEEAPSLADAFVTRSRRALCEPTPDSVGTAPTQGGQSERRHSPSLPPSRAEDTEAPPRQAMTY